MYIEITDSTDEIGTHRYATGYKGGIREISNTIVQLQEVTTKSVLLFIFYVFLKCASKQLVESVAKLLGKVNV